MRPSHVRQALLCAAKAKQPIFVDSSPGEGKTTLGIDVAESDLRLPWLILRLAYLEPPDIHGLPVPAQNGKMFDWLPSSYLHQMVENPYVCILDEFLQSAQAVQNAAAQMINERRVGPFTLHPDTVFFAFSNRTKDRAGVQPMPGHVANRFVHVSMETNVDDWVSWASAKNIREEIIGFIKYSFAQPMKRSDGTQGSLLSDYNPDVRANPTPRSWAALSAILDADPTPDILSNMILGTVGENAGNVFSSFLKTYQEIPSKEDILKRPDTTRIPLRLDIRYATTTAAGRWAKEENFDALYTYVSRMGLEYLYLFFQVAFGKNQNLKSHPSYLKHKAKFDTIRT